MNMGIVSNVLVYCTYIIHCPENNAITNEILIRSSSAYAYNLP